MGNNRSTFTGKLGFVLSAAGSAVGLGNIWRFPYLAAQYGGGIFLLVYVLLALTFGFSLMSAEISIGRKTGLSAIGAFSALNKRFVFIGNLASVVPMIILSYYCVIGGWVIKYMKLFIGGNGAVAAQDGYFIKFIEGFGEPLLWFFVYALFTALAVFAGVDKGVERVSKIFMPILVLLSLFIAVYTVFLPGALDGIKYYLVPDFSKFSIKTVLAAMGQLFYSMSLAMGIMITYGSYMKKNVNIESSVRQISIFDTGIAFLTGFMIVPSVFVFSRGNEEALLSGPSLMFEMLPKVFTSMWGGRIIGIAFFILVLFAALTSSISLMETVVSILCDKFKLKRTISCSVVFAGMIIMGLPSALGYSIFSDFKILGMQILDFVDFITNSVIMPIVALLTAIFVGYIIKPQTLIDEAEITAPFKKKLLFTVVIKYFAPICIILILVSSVLNQFGIFTI